MAAVFALMASRNKPAVQELLEEDAVHATRGGGLKLVGDGEDSEGGGNTIGVVERTSPVLVTPGVVCGIAPANFLTSVPEVTTQTCSRPGVLGRSR